MSAQEHDLYMLGFEWATRRLDDAGGEPQVALRQLDTLKDLIPLSTAFVAGAMARLCPLGGNR